MKRLGRLVMEHRSIGSVLHLLAHRGSRGRRYWQGGCVVCDAVWVALLAEPGFREGLDAGIADAKAGRLYVRDGAGGWKKGSDWPVDDEQDPA